MTHRTSSDKAEYLLNFDIIRICGIAAVVLLHVSGRVLQAYGGTTSDGWWAGNIGNSASRWAVPSLIMLAGALHLDAQKTELPFSFLKRRAKRIIVPLVGWFVIYFLWVHVWWGQSLSSEFILKRILLGGPYYHLYFFYVIGSLYLVTPALRLYFRFATIDARKKMIIALLFLGCLDSFVFYLFYHQPGWYDSIFSLPLLVVFTIGFAGYFLAGHELRTMTFSRSATYWAVVGLLLAFVTTTLGTYVLMRRFGIFSFGPYLYDNFSPTCIFMSLCVFVFFKEEYVLKDFVGGNTRSYEFLKITLAPSTFGIYLIHPIFIDILGRFVSFEGLGKDAIIHLDPWTGIPFFFILVVTLSFLTTSIIQRIPYLKVIVGSW